MPIDRNTFNEAQRPLEDRILEFLTENSANAYSLAEIVVEIEERDPQYISMALIVDKELYNKYKDAFNALIKNGKIEQSGIRGSTYFAVKN